MKPIMRTYQNEEDYWCIREFLREVSMQNNRRDFSWPLLRWDYWRWHINENIFHFDLCEVMNQWDLQNFIYWNHGSKSGNSASASHHTGRFVQ